MLGPWLDNKILSYLIEWLKNIFITDGKLQSIYILLCFTSWDLIWHTHTTYWIPTGIHFHITLFSIFYLQLFCIISCIVCAIINHMYVVLLIDWNSLFRNLLTRLYRERTLGKFSGISNSYRLSPRFLCLPTALLFFARVVGLRSS